MKSLDNPIKQFEFKLAKHLRKVLNLDMDAKKNNQEYLDQMCFLDSDGKPIKNYSLAEMIEMAKNSEFGCVWYSEKGPIQITKEGTLHPI